MHFYCRTIAQTPSENRVFLDFQNRLLGDGGNYAFYTTWAPMGGQGTPPSGSYLLDGRQSHTAVWTGTEMIMWGGEYGGGAYPAFSRGDGGRYNPVNNTWTPTSSYGAPSPRTYHSAVWTGNEMIIWGGAGVFGGPFNDGYAYVPATDTWSPINNNGAPSPRGGHSAVWTGSKMIVWGGTSSSNLIGFTFLVDYYNYIMTGDLNDGGLYDPGLDSWTPITTNGAPVARMFHTAVWTGSQMIVWGGAGTSTNTLNSGGSYNPGSDYWTPISLTGAPSPRLGHTAIWTGNEMIVWGGSSVAYFLYTSLFNTGAKYSPATDSWVPLSTTGAPSQRTESTAVWTGTEMIVWGGIDGTYSNTGGRYNPSADSWSPVSTYNAPGGRAFHTAVWTGNEMLVYGGDPYSDLWSYTPGQIMYLYQQP